MRQLFERANEMGLADTPIRIRLNFGEDPDDLLAAELDGDYLEVGGLDNLVGVEHEHAVLVADWE